MERDLIKGLVERAGVNLRIDKVLLLQPISLPAGSTCRAFETRRVMTLAEVCLSAAEERLSLFDPAGKAIAAELSRGNAEAWRKILRILDRAADGAGFEDPLRLKPVPVGEHPQVIQVSPHAEVQRLYGFEAGITPPCFALCEAHVKTGKPKRDGDKKASGSQTKAMRRGVQRMMEWMNAEPIAGSHRLRVRRGGTR